MENKIENYVMLFGLFRRLVGFGIEKELMFYWGNYYFLGKDECDVILNKDIDWLDGYDIEKYKFVVFVYFVLELVGMLFEEIDMLKRNFKNWEVWIDCNILIWYELFVECYGFMFVYFIEMGVVGL